MVEWFALQHIDKRFGSARPLRDLYLVMHPG